MKAHIHTLIVSQLLSAATKKTQGALLWHSLMCACVFQKREAFCQLLQLMKNKHSNQDEPDMISIFIGTWNMG